jgi:hypothetical protein
MTDRLQSGARRWTSRMLLAAAIGACVGSARAEVGLEGAEYALVGRPAGDQTHPAIAFGASRGFVVWQDNATDGDALGISARRLDLNGAAVGDAFRVNSDAAGDQENARVTLLADGSAVFVWQSGVRGSQAILARVLGADGIFKGESVTLSAEGSDNRSASVASLSDGSAVIVWASTSADGDRLGVVAQKLSASGVPVGERVTVNQYANDNQRHPSVAALPDGGYAVVWISEQQTGLNRTDVYLRRFGSDGAAIEDEARVNPGTRPCMGTSVVSVGGGALAIAWSEVEVSSGQPVWGVRGVWLDAAGNRGSVVPISGTQAGSHTQVQLAVSGDRILATWVGSKLDNYGLGVGGRLLTLDGTPVGPVQTLNSVGVQDQENPTVAGQGNGKFLAAWTTWAGLKTGMNLAAQRLAPQASALVALEAPVVSGLSSWQIKAAWAPVTGLPVDHYEVFFDGASVGQSVTDSFWSSPDVLPGTTHSVQVTYVLTDGRRAPLSTSAQGRSWGKDLSGDGLPDDWQSQFFGATPTAWPAPGVDSDGDGVSNRDEFLSGTNPKDGADALKVAVRPTTQGLELAWSSHAGGVYQLQSSSDLSDWSNVGGYRFATANRDSVILQGAPAQGYFRVNRIR